ncbi:MAG: SurA N-terminal domain-containing protein [Deltaproteobacteria bacterium]|jgi:peptidyl-prolyl cis-trans isomerase SurA|nr:SurA N-terminal domain-containing protein [Deltaproteobacteria bacterium]
MSNRHLSLKNHFCGLATSVALFVLFLFVFQGPALAATSVDRIVALVNNDIITLSELKAQLNLVKKNQRGALPPGPTLERQVLDSMIELELLNQEARRMGIMVSEQEVDGVIAKIQSDNNINEAQFKGSLKQSNISYADYRANLKNEILKEKVLYRNIVQRVVVTDAEVEKFLAGEGPKDVGLYIGGSVASDKVRFLFLPSSPNKSREVVERAMTIKREIDAGLSFAEAARQYSKGPGANAGGDTGTTIGELAEQLKAVALSMAPGQTSEPLDGGQVVLLLHVQARPASSPPPPSDDSAGDKTKPDMGSFSPEQRDMARRQLEQVKLRQRYEIWLNDLKAKANIKVTL